LEILDSLKNKIYETAKTAAKKSNEIVETTKIKFAISDAEAKIAQTMKEMGEMIYDAYKNGEEPEDEYLEKCSAIDDVFENINDLKERLCEVKDIKVCSECNKETDNEAAYCSACGKKF